MRFLGYDNYRNSYGGRVEALITDHLRVSLLDMEKYKAMSFFFLCEKIVIR
jgi:hypothetical protein